ncbi:hypothetical protein RIF29_28799 [Crotalaria pallida]|uniref:GTP cyclohydrolase II domain-containing protein n=1 Tax=Crotalaria pallida TaxID=3830 RepID=A0AAN9EIJ7_CROPI
MYCRAIIVKLIDLSYGRGRCDCGNQLDLAMQLIEEADRGVVFYLRGHEGRGIGLGYKLKAYNLQDQGRDTVQANIELGLAVDARVRTMLLMTNNPAKFIGLKGYGLAVLGRVPVLTTITEENKRYLETKRTKMGHIYGSDIQGSLPGFNDPILGGDVCIRRIKPDCFTPHQTKPLLPLLLSHTHSS